MRNTDILQRELKLMEAIYNGDITNIRKNIKGGIFKEKLDLNKLMRCPDGTYQTPLYLSVLLSNTAADRTSDASNPETTRSQTIPKYLLKHGADSSLSVEQRGLFESPFLCALRLNSNCTSILIKSNINPNDMDKKTLTTALMYAAKNSPQWIKPIIEKGAEVNAKNNIGYTALTYSVSHESFDWPTDSANPSLSATECLLKNGADPNITDYYGNTSLWNVGAYNLLVYKLLKTYGADFNALNVRNENVLFKAIPFASPETVSFLIKSGADPNTKNNLSQSPLNRIAYCNYGNNSHFHQIFKILVDKIDDMNTRNSDQFHFGRTPLHYASSFGWTDIIETMITKGANVNAKDIYDITPILLSNSEKTCELLMSKGADVTIKSSKGSTLLMRSAIMGWNGVVDKLLAMENIDLNARDYKGKTAAVHAIENKNYEISQKIIDAGGRINYINRDFHFDRATMPKNNVRNFTKSLNLHT